MAGRAADSVAPARVTVTIATWSPSRELQVGDPCPGDREEAGRVTTR
jgi:hypothetical protein